MYAGNLAGTLVSDAIILQCARAVPICRNPWRSSIIQFGPIWAATVLIGRSLVAPVIEELFFRKLLIDRMRKYGQRAAVVVSAVAFTLSTATFRRCFMRLRSASRSVTSTSQRTAIDYTIALHMLINAAWAACCRCSCSKAGDGGCRGIYGY